MDAGSRSKLGRSHGESKFSLWVMLKSFGSCSNLSHGQSKRTVEVELVDPSCAGAPILLSPLSGKLEDVDGIFAGPRTGVGSATFLFEGQHLQTPCC